MPSWPFFAYALRTSAEPESLVAAARERLRALDPTVPLYEVRTMDDVLGESVAPARSSMLLVALFAVLALALAVIGVFGVLSYTVSQRTAELGIRLALGASARSVGLLVLGQGMLQVAAGVLLGLAGAFALTRFLASLLFGVTPTDPATFAGGRGAPRRHRRAGELAAGAPRDEGRSDDGPETGVGALDPHLTGRWRTRPCPGSAAPPGSAG